MKLAETPWSVRREAKQGEFVTDVVIRGAHDRHIALVSHVNVEHGLVIAAAPELLGACKMAILYRDRLPDELVKAIIAAIKKAEGTQS